MNLNREPTANPNARKHLQRPTALLASSQFLNRAP
jgi:hypothetical protein